MSFSSDGIPNHEYLDAYLADGRDGKYISGGVKSYSNDHTIPLVPTKLDTPQTTNSGTIGVSISGGVFFNPYEGDGSGTIAIDDQSEIDGIPFIDPCNGHPLPDGTVYHYHGVPYCVASAVDRDGEHSHIVGYLLDGYPIYGPQGEGGATPTDLDPCMGHFGSTPEFPEGVYHYHTLKTSPYVPNCFHGRATQGGRP
jgi:hypothetical protein